MTHVRKIWSIYWDKAWLTIFPGPPASHCTPTGPGNLAQYSSWISPTFLEVRVRVTVSTPYAKMYSPFVLNELDLAKLTQLRRSWSLYGKMYPTGYSVKFTHFSWLNDLPNWAHFPIKWGCWIGWQPGMSLANQGYICHSFHMCVVSFHLCGLYFRDVWATLGPIYPPWQE